MRPVLALAGAIELNQVTRWLAAAVDLSTTHTNDAAFLFVQVVTITVTHRANVYAVRVNGNSWFEFTIDDVCTEVNTLVPGKCARVPGMDKAASVGLNEYALFS